MKPVGFHHWLVIVLLALSGYAQAAEVTFQSGEGDAARKAAVESATRNGVAYVPLGSLVRQLGGEVQTTEQRITVEYGGYAAIIEPGQALVSGSLQQFSISQPVIESGGEAWIALDDVPPLFRQAFGTSVASSQPPAPAPAATDEPLEDELLEQVTQEPATVQPAAAPAQRLVVIDPGHGGTDIGTKGEALEEKALTLDLAKRVAHAIESGPGGIKVAFTRTDDSALSMLDRVNKAIQGGSVFVSLHGGAALAPTLTGIQVFYSSDDAVGEADSTGVNSGMKAAERYRYAQASRALAEALSTALSEQEGLVLAGSHAARSPILHHVPMPGVLIEVGYLTNPADEAALATPEHLDKLAAAVATGMQRYLGVGATAAPTSATEAPQQ